MSPRDAASTLGIALDSDEAAIKAAWRFMLANYHPDKYKSSSESEKKYAESLMIRVNEAKTVMLAYARGEIKDRPSTAPNTQTHRTSSTQPDNTSENGRRQAPVHNDEQATQHSENIYRPNTSSKQHRPTRSRRSDVFDDDIIGTNRTGNGNNHVFDYTGETTPPITRGNGQGTYQANSGPVNVEAHESEQTSHKNESRRTHNKANHAKTFKGDFGRSIPNQEYDIMREYEAYAKKMYSKATDIFSWSWSALATIITIVATMFAGIGGPMLPSDISGASFDDMMTADASMAAPFVCVFALIAKLIIVDFIAAPQIAKATRKVSWSMIPIDIICGIVTYAIVSAFYPSGTGIALIACAISVFCDLLAILAAEIRRRRISANL